MPLSPFNLNNFNSNYGFTVTTQDGYQLVASAGDFNGDDYSDYIIGLAYQMLTVRARLVFPSYYMVMHLIKI